MKTLTEQKIDNLVRFIRNQKRMKQELNKFKAPFIITQPEKDLDFKIL